MTPVEGIEYCTAHDDVWLEGQEECQSAYLEHLGNNGTACVGHPLWWGDMRARDEAIIRAAIEHADRSVMVPNFDAIIAAAEETP